MNNLKKLERYAAFFYRNLTLLVVLCILLTGAVIVGVWSGMVAMALMVVMAFTGGAIMQRRPSAQMRKGHRYATFIFIVIYVLHKAVV